MDAVLDEPWVRDFHLTGSSYICNPPVTTTDIDVVVLTTHDPDEKLKALGWNDEGLPEFYTGNDNGGFVSWRKGRVNLVVTQDRRFFDNFVQATELAKRLNILQKEDRIALFQLVLYGVAAENQASPSPSLADLIPF